MRSASGYTDAVTGAVANARGELPATFKLTGTDYYSVDSAGHPPAPTTPIDAKWINAMTDEMAYALALGNPTTPSGVTFSDSTNQQLASILQGVPAIYAATADTTEISTARNRAILGGFGRVSGTGVVIAGSGTTGNAPTVSGTLGCLISGYGLDGHIIFAGGRNVGLGIYANQEDVDVAGDFNVLGSALAEDYAGIDGDIDFTGSYCTALSVQGGNMSSPKAGFALGSILPQISGSFAGALASYGAAVGGDRAIALASDWTNPEGDRSATLACKGGGLTAYLTVSGDHSAAIGCETDATTDVAGDGCVLLASEGAIPAYETSPGNPGDHQIYGGVKILGTPTRTFRINVGTGSFYALADGLDDANFADADSRAVKQNASGGSAYNAGLADFAEWFPTLDGEYLAPGTIVTRRRKGVRPAESRDVILGAVSWGAAVAGNRPNGDGDIDPAKWSLVALMGQVQVKVDSTVTNEAIDAAESKHMVLCVRADQNGVGTVAGYGNDALMPTRLQAMEVTRPGYCLCLVR